MPMGNHRDRALPEHTHAKLIALLQAARDLITPELRDAFPDLVGTLDSGIQALAASLQREARGEPALRPTKDNVRDNYVPALLPSAVNADDLKRSLARLAAVLGQVEPLQLLLDSLLPLVGQCEDLQEVEDYEREHLAAEAEARAAFDHLAAKPEGPRRPQLWVGFVRGDVIAIAGSEGDLRTALAGMDPHVECWTDHPERSIWKQIDEDLPPRLVSRALYLARQSAGLSTTGSRIAPWLCWAQSLWSTSTLMDLEDFSWVCGLVGQGHTSRTAMETVVVQAVRAREFAAPMPAANREPDAGGAPVRE